MPGTHNSSRIPVTSFDSVLKLMLSILERTGTFSDSNILFVSCSKNNGEQYERGSTEQYVAFIEFWIKYFLQEFPDDAKDLAIYEGTSGAKEAVMEMKNNEDDSLVKTASEKLRSVIAYYDTELFGVSEPLLL